MNFFFKPIAWVQSTGSESMEHHFNWRVIWETSRRMQSLVREIFIGSQHCQRAYQAEEVRERQRGRQGWWAVKRRLRAHIWSLRHTGDKNMRCSRRKIEATKWRGLRPWEQWRITRSAWEDEKWPRGCRKDRQQQQIKLRIYFGPWQPAPNSSSHL